MAIDSGGATVAYRKMRLGGAEPSRFTPRSKPAVLDVDGWRLGLAVCKGELSVKQAVEVPGARALQPGRFPVSIPGLVVTPPGSGHPQSSKRYMYQPGLVAGAAMKSDSP